MSESAILTAARAAVLAALPGWRDWSDDPSAVRPDKLGAFHVTVTRRGSVPAAMGSALSEVQMEIVAEAFLEFGADQDGRRIATDRGREVLDGLRQDRDLAALLDFVTAAALDVELGQGERRVARVTVALSALATF